eukprot:scaffold85_cov175-Ochromonas_danica.AAC.23
MAWIKKNPTSTTSTAKQQRAEWRRNAIIESLAFSRACVVCTPRHCLVVVAAAAAARSSHTRHLLWIATQPFCSARLRHTSNTIESKNYLQPFALNWCEFY